MLPVILKGSLRLLEVNITSFFNLNIGSAIGNITGAFI